MSKYIKTITLSAIIAFCFFNITAKAQTLASNNGLTFTTVTSEESFVTPPTPVNYSEVRNSIEYPVSCRKNGIEGTVLTKILVSKEGTPLKYEIIKSADQAFSEACKSKINSFI